jgi:tripartite-type tricarboxylate transporter receptor subunit TctC
MWSLACSVLLPRLRVSVAAVVGVAALLVATGAQAQSYPSRPVRVVVPFAPGGATDATARLISKHLSQRLGQNFIIDNKPGADTAIGAEFAAKSAPDGYTLLFTNDATFVLNPLLFPSLPYKPSRDFDAVATVAYLNLTLAVSGELPVKTFKDLVDYTKAKSGTIAYGSSGVGGQAHLMGEMYKKLTNTEIVHVPYKGLAPALTDVMGGRVVFTFPTISTIQGFVKDGRVKALAISGDKRSPLLPDVPTFAEIGYKEMDIGAWYAFLAPAGTPKEVIAKINAAVAAILSDPELEKDFISRGMQPMVQTPEQFTAFIRSETTRMVSIIKASGAKVE